MGEGDAEVEAPAFMPGEDVHHRSSDERADLKPGEGMDFKGDSAHL
jgi:hypothetical protein